MLTQCADDRRHLDRFRARAKDGENLRCHCSTRQSIALFLQAALDHLATPTSDWQVRVARCYRRRDIHPPTRLGWVSRTPRLIPPVSHLLWRRQRCAVWASVAGRSGGLGLVCTSTCLVVCLCNHSVALLSGITNLIRAPSTCRIGSARSHIASTTSIPCSRQVSRQISAKSPFPSIPTCA